MPTTEFLLTSLLVVLMPGTGVIYTISVGLTRGARASLFAALGCTLGIVPHLLASVLGLAAVLHTSALAFQVFKIVGVCYLAYLAFTMWRESGSLALGGETRERAYGAIAVRAVLINILNPKLSIFFLAFLPQFVPVESASAVPAMLAMSGTFMLMTLLVFVMYGMLAHRVSFWIASSSRQVRNVQRGFAALFVALGLKLATMERS